MKNPFKGLQTHIQRNVDLQNIFKRYRTIYNINNITDGSLAAWACGCGWLGSNPLQSFLDVWRNGRRGGKVVAHGPETSWNCPDCPIWSAPMESITFIIRSVGQRDLVAFWIGVGEGPSRHHGLRVFWIVGLLQRALFLRLDAIGCFKAESFPTVPLGTRTTSILTSTRSCPPGRCRWFGWGWPPVQGWDFGGRRPPKSPLRRKAGNNYCKTQQHPIRLLTMKQWGTIEEICTDCR